MAEIYEGKVFGLFDPLQVKETPDAIMVRGTTFVLKVSRTSGQLISAQAEGIEFLAKAPPCQGRTLASSPPMKAGPRPPAAWTGRGSATRWHAKSIPGSSVAN